MDAAECRSHSDDACQGEDVEGGNRIADEAPFLVTEAAHQGDIESQREAQSPRDRIHDDTDEEEGIREEHEFR